MLTLLFKMSFASLRLLASAALLLQLLHAASAGNGYHYDPPAVSVSLSGNSASGHHFAPLPTVVPLPPVPALPPLPTPRPRTQLQPQPLLQLHPAPVSKSIAAAYRPKNAPPLQTALSQISQTQQGVQIFGARIPGRGPTLAPIVVPSAPAAARTVGVQPQQRGLYSQLAVPQFPFTAPSAPGGFGTPAPVLQSVYEQPVQYPVSGPDRDFYVINGRQLKQYAVIEVIDNDIEPSTGPFLTAPFFDSVRARIGASGTGAIPTLPYPAARQNPIQIAQQRLAQQRSVGGTGGGNAVTLGSGGLGFIRLPNGSVYLGSGSLAFASGQDQTRSLIEARTRSDDIRPDALHFGHGPLGGKSNFFPFK